MARYVRLPRAFHQADSEVRDRGSPAPPVREGRLTREELVARIEFEGRRERTGYSPWIKILGSGTLKPGIKPLGVGRTIAELRERHRSVCFSEIPLDMLDRLITGGASTGSVFARTSSLLAGEHRCGIWTRRASTASLCTS